MMDVRRGSGQTLSGTLCKTPRDLCALLKMGVGVVRRAEVTPWQAA